MSESDYEKLYRRHQETLTDLNRLRDLHGRAVADSDRARAVLAGVVEAERRDQSESAYFIPGDSFLGIHLALVVDPFLVETYFDGFKEADGELARGETLTRGEVFGDPQS